MSKILKHLYSIATVLFVVGGLLIYQGEKSGSIAIGIALLINVVYRLISIDIGNLKKLIPLDILKLVSAVFLAVTVFLFFIDFEALQYVIVAIVFDVLLNIDDLFHKKRA